MIGDGDAHIAKQFCLVVCLFVNVLKAVDFFLPKWNLR